MDDVSVFHGRRSGDLEDLLRFDGEASPTVLVSEGKVYKPHSGYLQDLCHQPRGSESVASILSSGFVSHTLALRAFRGASLSRYFGVVTDARGNFVKETTGAIEFRQPDWRERSGHRLRPPADIDTVDRSIVFSIHGDYCVYAHILFETVGTAFAMRSFFSNGAAQLVLPSNIASFPDDVLDAIEFPKSARCRLLSEHSRASNLIVSSACSSGPTYAPNDVIVDLAGYCRARYGGAGPSPRRLYLTRRGSRNTSVRDYLEDAELSSRLRELGFVTVNPGTLSFAEQVALLSQAEIVVGAHGGGFANAIFAPKGCLVIDILPSHWATIGGMFTANLTNLFGHFYAYLIADSLRVDAGYSVSLDPSLVVDKVRSFMARL